MTNPVIDLNGAALGEDLTTRDVMPGFGARYQALLFPQGVNLSDADGNSFNLVTLTIPLTSIERNDWITVGAPPSDFFSFVSVGGVPLGDLEVFGGAYAPVGTVGGNSYVTSSRVVGQNVEVYIYLRDPQLGQVPATAAQMEAVLNSLHFVNQFGNRSGGTFQVTVTATDTFNETDTSVLTTYLFNPGANAYPAITTLGGGNEAIVTVNQGATVVVDNDATDSDAGDIQTWEIDPDPLGSPDAALFAIDPATGVLTFVNPAQIGVYQIAVAVTDFVGRRDVQQITVTVAPPNSPPDAQDDAYTVVIDRALQITTLFANDADVEDGSLTYASHFSRIVDQPLHGQLIDNNDGTFTYTPDAGFTGADSFTYEVRDSNGALDTATVALTVVAPVLDFSDTPSGLKFDFDGSGDPTGDTVAEVVNIRIGDSPDFPGAPLRVVGQGAEIDFSTVLAGTGVAATEASRIIGTRSRDTFAVLVDQAVTIEGGDEPDPFGDSGGDSFYITGNGVTALGQGGDDAFSIFGSGGKVDGGSGDYDKINLEPLTGGGISYTIQRFADGMGGLGTDAEGYFQATYVHDGLTSTYRIKNVEQFQFGFGTGQTDAASIDIDMPGVGTVRVYTSSGDDTIRVNADSFVHIADAGVNTITLSGGQSTVSLWDGTNTLDSGEDAGESGSGDFDLVSWAKISSNPDFNIGSIAFDLAVRDANGFAAVNVVNPDGTIRIDRIKNVEEILGSGGDDVMRGDDATLADGGDNIFFGLLGNDSLEGRGGADQLEGGEGNDTISGGDGADFLRGGAFDIAYSQIPGVLTGPVTDDDRLNGGAGNDTIYGGDERNRLGVVDTDTAVYSGSREDYAITADTDLYGNAGFRIEDLRANGAANEGVDFVYQVELFEFADGTLTAAELLFVNARPEFTSAAAVIAGENQTLAVDVDAVDADAGQTLTYTIVGGADAGKFVIDAATGVLSFVAAPDFELPGDAGADNHYNVRVRATDNFTRSKFAEQDIAITIGDENEAPVVAVAIANQYSLENELWQFQVPAATFSDPESRPLVLSATLEDGAPLPSWLSFNALTRVFSGTPPQDSDGTISLRVTATDDGNSSISSVFLLNISPADIYINGSPIAENSPNGALIGDLTIFENGALDNFTTFTLVSGEGDEDNNIVRIVGNKLEVNGDINFEANPTLNLRIRATTPEGLFYEKTFEYIVTDVNEAPNSFLTDRQGYILEENRNELFSSVIPISGVYIIDPDSDPQFRANDVTVDDSRFSLLPIDDMGGFILQANSGALFDYESEPSITLTLTSGDLSTSFVVDITDINEAPTAIATANVVPAINEVAWTSGSGTVRTKVADIVVTDPDIREAFRINQVLSSDPRFEVVGTELFLKAAQSIDYETEQSIELNLTTGLQSVVPVSTTLQLVVADIDETPTAIGVLDAVSSIDENTATRTKIADVVVVDPDTQAAFRNNPVTVNDARFEVVNGELFLKAGQSIDHEATPLINLTLGTGTLTTSLTLGVIDVNEAPTGITFTGGPIAENSANGTVIGTLSAIDPDLFDSFTYTLVSGTGSADNGLVSIIGNQIRVNGAIDFETNPTLDLRVQVTDARGATFERTQIIAVTDVYEGPPVNVVTGTSGSDAGVSGVPSTFRGFLLGIFFPDIFRGLRGASGIDSIDGGGGDDWIYGFGGNDTIIGGQGNDRLYGDTADGLNESRQRSVFATGVDGNDSIFGGEGNDSIWGGGGGDTLNGGSGRDSLTGGSGADWFVFDDGDSGLASGLRDLIADFSRADGDRIDLRPIDGNPATGRDDPLTLFASQATALGTIGAVYLGARTGGVQTIFINTSASAGFEMAIDVVTGVNLQARDFLL